MIIIFQFYIVNVREVFSLNFLSHVSSYKVFQAIFALESNVRTPYLWYKLRSTPQFHTSVQLEDHTFSAPKIPQFNTKGPLLFSLRIPQFHTKNPSFYIELLNSYFCQFFCVELRSFCCWTEGRVELRGFWGWTDGCVELRGCETEGFLMWNWGISEAEKEWPFCVQLRGSVWNWGIFFTK